MIVVVLCVCFFVFQHVSFFKEDNIMFFCFSSIYNTKTHPNASLASIQENKSENKRQANPCKSRERDWELLPVRHFVHFGGEVLFRLVVACEGFRGVLVFAEHVEFCGAF